MGVYIYIFMYLMEHKVCSVTSEPTQSSSRRESLKDSSVLLTTVFIIIKKKKNSEKKLNLNVAYHYPQHII